MGKLYKRAGVWWADFRDAKGRRHRWSLRTADKEVAKRRLRELELAPPDRAAHGQATLGEAVTHYVDVALAGRAAGTVESSQQKVRHLVRLFGADRPLPMARADVQRYIATRLQEAASHGSVSKELVALRGALRESGHDAGVVPRFAARYQPRTRHLSPEQFSGVLANLAPRRRLWLMVAAYLGGRDSEINGHRVGDVDLRAESVRVRGTKTAAARRTLPIPPALRPWLVERCEGADPGAPLVERWTNRRRDISAAYWKVVGWTPPKNWSKGTAHGGGSIAGAPRLSPNDLRRTFASWLKQAGVDSLAVAHLLGHSSTRMVELVYGRLTMDTYRAAVAVLPACDAGVPKQVHKTTSGGTRGTSEHRATALNAVPRGGIEPPTRGFSGPESAEGSAPQPPELTVIRGRRR